MLNRMELLRTFLVAYETLNFREAAIRLSVSPQVVTRAVKELEGHLGELLFHRSTRSVQPSDFCERFVAQARQALQGVDALFAAARPLKDERVEGLVRIAAPAMQGRRFVMPVLERLARQHPGLCFDLRLSVDWNDTRVSTPPFASMYWTAAQQLAHLTSNGASVRTGDLYASGTVSGDTRDQVGSFLELTWSGKEPVKLSDGSTRGFLEDGDKVTISGTTIGAAGVEIGLGEVTGTILA